MNSKKSLKRSLCSNIIYILSFIIIFSAINTVIYVHAEDTESTPEQQYTTAINNLDDSLKELNESLSSFNSFITSTEQTYIVEGSANIYTPLSYNALTVEISNAKTLYGELTGKINTASKTLDDILAEYKAAKESGLTTDALAEKQTELKEKAEKALKNLSPDDCFSLISKSTYSIQDKVNTLVKRADKSKLNAKLETAKSKKKSNYFEKEFNELQKVIEDTKKVYDNSNATTSEVNAAVTSLNNAISALRVIYTTKGNTRYYNISNFEANGNDSLSDSAAIQAALDLASEDYKIEIAFPKGTFYLSKSLFIQSNTTLKLSSNTIIRRMDSSLKYNLIHSSDSKHKKDTIGGYDLAHDIILDGGTWDGGNISKAKSDTNLLYFGHCNRITIQNASIKNCYGSHAIEFAGVNNGIINNCTFSKFRYDSTNFTSEAIQLDICWKDSDGSAWAPGYKKDKTTCKNITITNNTITDYPRGIGTHHILSGHQYSNIVIKNNKIKSPYVKGSAKTTGIFLNGIKKMTVNSNQIDGYHYGIWIRSSSGLTVKSNILKYNSIANLIYAGNNVSDKKVLFTFVSIKDKKVKKTENPKSGKKKIYYTAPTMKKGYIKVGGKTYRFKKSKKYFTVKLKKKLKKNQKIVMYGTDKYKNKFYRNYTVK